MSSQGEIYRDFGEYAVAFFGSLWYDTRWGESDYPDFLNIPFGRKYSMRYDIQTANMWKRIFAAIFDGILLVTLAVLVATVVSSVLDYNNQAKALEEKYIYFESGDGVDFEITQEDYDLLTPEQQEKFNQAYEALSTDEDTLYVYNMLISLSIVIISVSGLISFAVLEFIVPLLLKNGQTLGKKIFGLAVMRPDAVKISAVSLFIRTFMAKYAIETMVPLLMGLMILWGAVGVLGPILVLGILLLQIMLLLRNEHRTPIHDKLAMTVVVDYNSQMIFPTKEAQLEHEQKIQENVNSIY